MLKIEKFVTASPEQWEIVIEGMRNPKNSWDRMDSFTCNIDDEECHENCKYTVSTCPVQWDGDFFILGPNDHTLMDQLNDGGPVHAKYRRMIPVWVTLTAPLFWWKEFDTYKVGTVTNSCSTMHKIHSKEFAFDDFSTDHLLTTDHELEDYLENNRDKDHWGALCPAYILGKTIGTLNYYREKFLSESDPRNKKQYWHQMIQLLPTSYNQKRTVMLNYEVLVGIYKWRKNHKLDEWHTFCDWIRELPYSELITGDEENATD